MRAEGTALGAEAITISFEGDSLGARPGETIAAALTAAGVRVFRETAHGERRGLFCGMGVCQDCLVRVAGRGVVRACLTKVEAGLEITRARDPIELGTSQALRPPAPAPFETDVLVIGAGAAGLAAAAAAGGMGADVLLADERPALGGQFYKQPVAGLGAAGADRQISAGRALIARTRAAGRRTPVRILSGTEAVAAFEPRDVLLATPDGPLLVRPARLVVATGAYERALPVPGWTLPGVMTTGAAQTLLRSYRVLPGRRVLVAGNGPLNWQVALELASAGAEVVALAEAAPAPGPRSLAALAAMAMTAPRLLLEGLACRGELAGRGVPLLHRNVLESVTATAAGLAARLSGGATYDVDAIAMGYGFLPQNEILRQLGCRHAFDPARGHLATVRTATCETSVAHVYAAGDCTGLGGAPAAEAEGLIAGHAAAASLGRAAEPVLEREVAAAHRALLRHRRFQRGLWRLFAPAGPPAPPALAETIVCRCEGVPLAAIERAARQGAAAIGSIKRETRAGMGRCQGRYCGPLIAGLLARAGLRSEDEHSFWAPRAPGKPVSLADIASLRLPEDATP